MVDRRFKVRSACYAILERRGKIFMLKRRNSGWQDGNYTLPSGHIERGETATNAMVREALEEVGIKIKPQDMKMSHVLHRNAPPNEYVDFYFVVKRWEGRAHNAEPEKSSMARWFEKNKLPANIVPFIPQVLRSVARKETYGEYGFAKGRRIGTQEGS